MTTKGKRKKKRTSAREELNPTRLAQSDFSSPLLTTVKSLQFTAFSMELPPATVIEPIRFRFIRVLKE